MAAPPEWPELPWGQPLPASVTPESDWPWAADEGVRCGWSGEILLCDDGAGLSRAYRRWEGPVEGPTSWIRCAGLEWCAGNLSEEQVGDRIYGRWAGRNPTHLGWEWALPAPVAAPIKTAPPAEGMVLDGGAWDDAARYALATQILACPGAGALERFPVQVLYDEQGPRKIRLQGFPPAELDALCLIRALAGAPRPGEEPSVEAMLSGS